MFDEADGGALVALAATEPDLDLVEEAAETDRRAAATLGVMHLTGDGIAADPDAAARWLAAAEDLGFPVDDWLAQLGLQRPLP
ncbi:hypothetical protein GCM10007977_047590 [Dactylosporangium sucinum]|uniref:Sel1 repeat family protein n=2 Tax=Dactylosporangium sucinum TaxID=1424081 RepID=A0A917TXQ6_9ACTN|nr:hypothetical protein GCM10007977_047590 [Dactylosporangium sucinum]